MTKLKHTPVTKVVTSLFVLVVILLIYGINKRFNQSEPVIVPQPVIDVISIAEVDEIITKNQREAKQQKAYEQKKKDDPDFAKRLGHPYFVE